MRSSVATVDLTRSSTRRDASPARAAAGPSASEKMSTDFDFASEMKSHRSEYVSA